MANKKPVEFYKQTQVLEKQPVKKVETDEILSGTDKFVFILSQHWKKISIALGSIAAVIVLLVIIQLVREKQDLALRHQFADAKDIDTAAALIAAHTDHPAAIGARFRLAAMKAEKGDFVSAAQTLQEIVLLDNADPYIKASAQLRAAAFMEQGKKDGEARAIYIALLNDPQVDELMRGEARFGAARLSLKLGKAADAAEYLKDVKDTADITASYWDIQNINLKKSLSLEKVAYKAPAPAPAAAPAAKPAPAPAPAAPAKK